MSERLLALTKRQRRLKAEEIARDVIDEQNRPSVCLDNTELLFDSSLRLNPLVLLQDISRNRLVVSSWNGTYDGKHLSFGYRGHPDFFQQAPSGYPVFSVSDNGLRGFETMKYNELIQFQPIESVIELRQANKLDKAKEHASTYVISDADGESPLRTYHSQPSIHHAAGQ